MIAVVALGCVFILIVGAVLLVMRSRGNNSYASSGDIPLPPNLSTEAQNSPRVANWRATLGSNVSCISPYQGMTECQVFLQAVNGTNSPQTYHGTLYMVVNGGVFATKMGAVQPQEFNPNSGPYDNGSYFKDVPCGGIISSVYRADSPDSEHLFDLPLNLRIGCS